jgi:hypothetical protein
MQTGLPDCSCYCLLREKTKTTRAVKSTQKGKLRTLGTLGRQYLNHGIAPAIQPNSGGHSGSVGPSRAEEAPSVGGMDAPKP